MTKEPLYISPRTTLLDLHNLIHSEYPNTRVHWVHGELTARNSFHNGADLLIVLSPEANSIRCYLQSAELADHPEHFPDLIIVGEPVCP